MADIKDCLLHDGEDEEDMASHYSFHGEDDDDQKPLLERKNDMGHVVKDRYNATFLIFYLMGLGGLLPWNFFINAQDYWMYKLGICNSTMHASTVPYNTSVNYYINSTPTPTPSGNNVTTLQSLFMNSLAVCAMLPGMIFQFLNTVFQKRISQNIRIIFSLIIMTALFIFTEILVKIDSCEWQEVFFIITLISVVLINSFAAVFQSSVFGLAAKLPQKYSGGYMAGQAMGGVFASVAMVVALACSSGPSDSALIFFLVAIIVLLLTIFGYILLTRLKFYKYLLLSNNTSHVNTESSTPTDAHQNHLSSRLMNERVDYAMQDTSSSASLLEVSRKLAVHMFCVMYVFFITLACFPAVTGKIKSESSGTVWTDKYFEPVTCYLLFNLGDWLGRTAASYIHVPSSSHNRILLTCVLARTAFPVLFAFCNYHPRYNLPVAIHEDWIYILIMILFAVSNGHFSTLSMQYGPKQVEPENSATAGSMLGLMMSVGLLLGAGASFLLTSWI